MVFYNRFCNYINETNTCKSLGFNYWPAAAFGFLFRTHYLFTCIYKMSIRPLYVDKNWMMVKCVVGFLSFHPCWHLAVINFQPVTLIQLLILTEGFVINSINMVNTDGIRLEFHLLYVIMFQPYILQCHVFDALHIFPAQGPISWMIFPW